MWHAMFVEQIPVAEKLMRTVLVYALVAVLIRSTGKRGLSGLNTLDIAVISLLSNVVQNAIIGNDLSITGGVVGAVTLVVVDTLANRLALVSPFFARVFDGTETKVIRDGTVLRPALRRIGMSPSTLDHAVRTQNGEDVSQVADGKVEPGGQLLLTLRPAEQGATKGDIDRLAAQLARMEAALAGRGGN